MECAAKEVVACIPGCCCGQGSSVQGLGFRV